MLLMTTMANSFIVIIIIDNCAGLDNADAGAGEMDLEMTTMTRFLVNN